jgi:hypothetical protein
MDMQYYRVIPNQVLLGWGQEKDFADIHAGMVVGWVHAPVTLMGQCRWGKGKLLATTLKLESAFGDDPVATVLVHDLLGYIGSSRFRPQKDVLAAPARRNREPAPSQEDGTGVPLSEAVAGPEIQAAEARKEAPAARE